MHADILRLQWSETFATPPASLVEAHRRMKQAELDCGKKI